MLTQDWSDIGQGAAISSTCIDQAAKDYRHEKRVIRLQEQRNERGGLSCRTPLTCDNGKRYLLVSRYSNRAYFQCADAMEALQYRLDHPNLRIIDLNDQEFAEQRLIGRFLGVAEKLKVQPAKVKFTDISRNADGELVNFGNTLLKDRKPIVKPIVSRSIVPPKLLVARFKAGKPLVTTGAAKCLKCGYTVSCQCKVADPRKMPVSQVSPHIAPVTASEQWLQDAHKYQGYIRYKGMKLCPMAMYWIGE